MLAHKLREAMAEELRGREIADEPIASLDPLNAKIVMESLREIHDRDKLTVIANLHTLDTARNYCDRIIGMRDGTIVFDGIARDLTTDVARGIYGAGRDFDEAATSTELERPMNGYGPKGDVAIAQDVPERYLDVAGRQELPA